MCWVSVMWGLCWFIAFWGPTTDLRLRANYVIRKRVGWISEKLWETTFNGVSHWNDVYYHYCGQRNVFLRLCRRILLCTWKRIVLYMRGIHGVTVIRIIYFTVCSYRHALHLFSLFLSWNPKTTVTPLCNNCTMHTDLHLYLLICQTLLSEVTYRSGTMQLTQQYVKEKPLKRIVTILMFNKAWHKCHRKSRNLKQRHRYRGIPLIK